MTEPQEPDEEYLDYPWMYEDSSFDSEDQPSIMPWLVPFLLIIGFLAILTTLLLLFL